jgi:hypothetical protein
MAATPRLRPAPDRRDCGARDALVGRVRAGFMETPSLRLTCPQARRLFDMRADVCHRILEALVEQGVLARYGDGQYGRREP